MIDKFKENTDKIAEIFLETLQRELPDHKIMITYSVFLDDNNESFGGWKHTKGMTIKDASWLQCFNICQMLINDED